MSKSSTSSSNASPRRRRGGAKPKIAEIVGPSNGVGHEHWHQQFYSKLMRKDTRTSCCNLSDCVPTQSRMINDHYEVLVEGEWTKVPQDVIQNVAAPDGGAHVCFPKQPSNRYPKG